ncbi:MAG: EamA family transporter [Methanomassiliicoccales archaeon]
MPVFKPASIGEGEFTKNKAIALTFLSSMMFATSYVAIKIGVEAGDPLAFQALAIGLGGILAVFLAVMRGNLTLRIYQKWEVWAAMLIGAISIALEFLGMTMTNASKGALIIGSTVVFAAPLSALVLKERFNRTSMVGIALGMIGLVSLTTGWNFKNLLEGEFLGDMMLIGSAATGATIWVLTKRALRRLTYDQWITGVYTLYPIPLFVFACATGASFALDLDSMIPTFYVGIMCTSIPSLLWAKGLTKITVTTSATIVLSEAIFGTLLGCIILGEVLTFPGIAGAAMIFAAIYISAKREESCEDKEEGVSCESHEMNSGHRSATEFC